MANIGNPFIQLHDIAARLNADIVRPDMRTLALIVRCAHTADDVWAGCRVARALSGYKDAGVSGYLSGPLFQPFVCDGDIFELEALKECADVYLAALTSGGF